MCSIIGLVRRIAESEESEEREEDNDFARRKVGDKRLPGSSSKRSLALDEDDGAETGEVADGKIWTVYAQTTPHV